MAIPYPGNTLWPNDWDKSTFHGRMIDILGVPPGGAAIFLKPNITGGVLTSIGSDAIVVPIERMVPVDPETSEFTVDIPATDDPQVSPTGWTYQVRIALGIQGVPDITFPMEAPVGTVVQLKNAARDANIVPSTGVPIINAYQYARSKGYAGTEDDFATLMASGVGGGGGAVTSVAGKVGAVILAKGDVGLSNVDNTSDAAKPVSAATQTALDAKYAKPSGGIPGADLDATTQASLGRADTALQSAPVASVAGRTGAVTLTKSDVGLGAVDNTADADKPISTAQATGFANAKNRLNHTGTQPISTVDNLQSTLDDKASKTAGATFTGTITVPTGTAAGHAVNKAQLDAVASSGGGTPVSRMVGTGLGLTGGGDLSADRTLAVDFAASGTSSATKAVRADDSRLSDARTPADASVTPAKLATATQASIDAKYTRPGTGIPKTDLDAATQTSLGKADSALQSAPVTSVASKTGAVTLAKADVGLANVDNTSDANKPVSTAQAAAIAATYTKPGTGIPASDLATAVQTSLGKADTALQSAPVTSVATKTGAVTLVKGDVGLGNVDNTSDASKPVSTATSTALAGKAPTTRAISAGTGLTGGGDLSADRSLAVSFAASGASSSTQAVRADDSRLSDARPPTDGSVTAAKLASGLVVPPANLGTGTASASTVLYGDGTWKTAPTGGSGGGTVTGKTITYTGSSWPARRTVTNSTTQRVSWLGNGPTPVDIAANDVIINSSGTVTSGRAWHPSGIGVGTAMYVGDTVTLANNSVTMRGKPLDYINVYPDRDSFAAMMDTWWASRVPTGFAGHYVLAIPLYPSDSNLAAAKAGSYDTQYAALGTMMNGVDPGGIVRLGWEMNTDQPWKATTATAADYVAVFRRAVNQIRSTMPRARICWNPNEGVGQVDATLCYPGDEYVDLIGIDAYDWWPAYNNATNWATHRDSTFGWNYWLNFAKTHGKLFCIPEWGTLWTTSVTGAGQGGNDDANYVNYVTQWMTDNKADIEFESFFMNDATLKNDLIGTTNPLTKAAYKAYLAGAPGIPTVTADTTTSQRVVAAGPTFDTTIPSGTSLSGYFVAEKDSTIHDCSVLFRSGGHSKAEIGLPGDDDLHLKVVSGATEDALTFTDALILKASTGHVYVPLRLGVGTNSPAEKLHIAEALTGARVSVKLENTAGSGSQSSAVILSGRAKTWTLATDVGLNGGDNFGIFSSTLGYPPVLMATGDGKVGIGTDAPATALDVAGALSLRNQATAPATPTGAATLYVDNSGVLKLVNSAGVVTTVGSGGGGSSLPAGGATGQVLAKASATDGDAAWAANVPSDGSVTSAKVVNGAITPAKLSATGTASSTTALYGDGTWKTAPTGIPAGGTTGQVLAKTSATDYAVGWTSSTLGAGSVGSTELATSAVSTVKIADGAVTLAKTTGVAAQLIYNKVSSNTTVAYAANQSYIYLCTAALTITLPALANVSNGSTYTIINAASTAVNVTVQTTGGAQIQRVTPPITLAQNQSMCVVKDSSDWFRCY